MSSNDIVTAVEIGKNGWAFFWPLLLVLEFGSSRLDLAPWQKVDLATLSV